VITELINEALFGAFVWGRTESVWCVRLVSRSAARGK
jgi:hypothetical protein